MKLGARSIMPWLVAILVLLVVISQTAAALRQSGSWVPRPRGPSVRLEDPYAPIERRLASSEFVLPQDMRNPLTFGATATAVQPPRVDRRPQPPPPPPRPVLTAIIWDNDPRATVRWNGRDYSVRQSGLFADFRVLSITRDQVVLDHAGETLTLRLPRKGE